MFILGHRHEASPELDADWTLSEDWVEECRLSEVRSQLIKTQLQAGRQVCYRSSGWSLCPRVKSNDQTTYAPVTYAGMVQVDDRPRTASTRRQMDFSVISSNMNGWVNGWCHVEHIYGKLIECIS